MPSPTDLPLFSYVVATHNCAPWLDVLATTAQRLMGGVSEICVADGGSTDGTAQTLQRMPGIRVVRSAPDRGIYDAWNHALPWVRGRYVGFLGVDDVPGLPFMAAAAAAVSAATQARRMAPALIYGDIHLHRRGRVRRLVAPKNLRLFGDDKPVFDLHHPGCLTRADLFDGQHSFDVSFQLAGDLDFYLRKAREVRAFGVLRLDEVQAHVADEGVSRRPEALAVYADEFARVEERSGQCLGHAHTVLPWLTLLAHSPKLFCWAKNLSWALRGRRLQAQQAS